MIADAIKALSQVLSPAMRTVLWKSIAIALVALAGVAVLLHRLLIWFADSGQASLETWLGPAYHTPIGIFGWILAIAAGLGLFVGSIFLTPAVTSLVATFFVDDVADKVEREHYPAQVPGTAVPVARATVQGVRTGLLALAVYLFSLPFLLVAGLGFVVFFLANAYLLSREYFELAAMRFRSPAEARALRKAHGTDVFMAGLFIAGFVSIPIVNLATPLFAMALMVHLHKRIGGPSRLITADERAALPSRG